MFSKTPTQHFIRPQVFLSLSDHWSRTNEDCYGLLYGTKTSDEIIISKSIEVFICNINSNENPNTETVPDSILTRHDLHIEMHPNHVYLGVYYIGQQCEGESPQHSSTRKVHQFIPKVPASFPAPSIGMTMRPLARGIKQNTHEHITYQIFNGAWGEEHGCQIYLNSYDSIVLDFVNKNTQKCDVATVDNVLLDTQKAENSKHGNRGILKTIMNIKTSENYDQLLAKLVDHQEQAKVAKKVGSDNSLDVETVKQVQMLEFLLNEQQNVRKPVNKIENLNDVNQVLQKHEQNITAAGVLSLISGNTTFQVEYIKQMKIRKLLKIDETECADRKNSSAGFTQQSSNWRPLGLNLD